MAKLLFSLLLVGGAAGSGLAVITGWLNYRLYGLDREQERPPFGLLLVGMIVQNGVLTYALIDAGLASPSIRAWLYTVGLVVTTGALGWMCAVSIADLALKESRDEATKHGTKEDPSE